MSDQLQKSTFRVVGIRQVMRALREEKAEKVYLADDVSDEICTQVLEAAAGKNVPVQRVITMRALSHMCHVDVPASCAAIMKDATK